MALEDGVVVGTCIHGKAIHYRYPCHKCEADRFVGRVADEMKAGWTPENGLLERIGRLFVSHLDELHARVNQ